jgi:hypothetical protein
MYEAIPWINFQPTNKAVSLKSSDSSQPATKEDIMYLQAKISDNSGYFAQRMIDYLQANYTLFPELVNNQANCATIFPVKSQYFSGIHIPNLPYNERFRRSENGDDYYRNRWGF